MSESNEAFGSLKPFSLEALKKETTPTPETFLGKPLLILFFNLGCPGCVGRAVPFANKMKVEHGDKINILGIHSNFEGTELSDSEIINKMEELYARFPFFRDAGSMTTFKEYEAGGTPHWILADKNGVIVQSIFGSDPNRALLRLDFSIQELITD
ncbi:TlpA family protein disulfide reductase [Galbibacter mesophilus]|uniref:TlpA family protein disulfide reductase n=1 Tax=Galbibacter mesophilus TaxID=379069 RepID=UPI00191ED20E|nr:TlpA disulfide reductase family protein [Galbibacter mesophilus]MCM5664176.1 TlpA family protein disulfide reductase [Galbibacter mesophilus]